MTAVGAAHRFGKQIRIHGQDMLGMHVEEIFKGRKPGVSVAPQQFMLELLRIAATRFAAARVCFSRTGATGKFQYSGTEFFVSSRSISLRNPSTRLQLSLSQL